MSGGAGMILDGCVLARLAFPGGTVTDPRAYLRGLGYDPPPLDRVANDAEPLVARVNHGVWIASCRCGAPGVPSPGGVVFLDQPMVWDPRCANVATDGDWRPVTVPGPDQRAAIEAVLRGRPRVEDRNWDGESLAELVAQNREHGDAIAEGC
jgi:hypothetical protein